MFIYEKKLQYPVKIAHPNPKLASIIISQYGGPDGELGASLRYLSQRYSMPFDEQKGLLTDKSEKTFFYFSQPFFHTEMKRSKLSAGLDPAYGRISNETVAPFFKYPIFFNALIKLTPSSSAYSDSG